MTKNDFNPDWDAMAVMVEEQQRMAKRIEELEARLAQTEQEPVAWMYINKIDRLIVHFEENARTPEDLEVAAVLRKLGRVYFAAYDMMNANSNQSSQAAYAEMIDIFRGKTNE